MTGGKDPDEIIQKFGAEGFKRCLDSAANDVEFSLLPNVQNMIYRLLPAEAII